MRQFHIFRQFLLAGVFLAILFFTFFYPKNARAESFNIILDVAVCNSNLICEVVIGEDYLACPSDCEPPPPPPPPPASSSSSQTSGSGISAPYSGGYTSSNLGQNQIGGKQIPSVGGGSNGAKDIPKSNPVGIKKPGSGVSGIGNKPDPFEEIGIDGTVLAAPYAKRAILKFQTFLPSLMTISWGKTATYELGASADSWYHQDFSKEIADLDSGTRYYYQIQLLDTLGRKMQYEGSFVTAFTDSSIRLPAVLDFITLPIKRPGQIEFKWNMKPSVLTVNDSIDEIILNNKANSSDAIFNLQKGVYVRLVRSSYSFPTDPYEGKVVYEGSGEYAIDTDISPGNFYFYSLFLMDKNGNHSAPSAIFRSVPDEKQNEAKKNSNLLFDPLLDDQNSYELPLESSKDQYPERCGVEYAENTPEGTYGIRYVQDGKQLFFEKQGQIEQMSADGRRLITMSIDSQNLEENDRVGTCLFSPATAAWNYYIFGKNEDKSRDLILPALSSVYGGKISYQIAIEVLKYNGKIDTLKRGKISFDNPENQTNFNAIQAGLFVGGILLIWAMIRRLRNRL